MLAVVQSVATIGIDGHPVRVEVQVGSGVPAFTLVGLPDTAVREARERVRSAIIASGYEWPLRRITVNLAPAGLRKQGSWFDLPIALGILAADRQVDDVWIPSHMVVGELGLDGDVRPVAGVLSVALCARSEGLPGVVVPVSNSDEATAAGHLRVVGVNHLGQFAAGLPEPAGDSVCKVKPEASASDSACGDMGEVAGQETAKLALEVAAAGGHHCLMIGEPGSGKTMLARRVPGILPPLDEDERITVSLLHSLAGVGTGAPHGSPAGSSSAHGLMSHRPFRSPHHSASITALVGGGSTHITPGEVSLAHAGVLFMDEFGEFRPSVLDALRQPLQDGEVSISRRAARVRFPARFMLVAASNPCPCGFLGSTRQACSCDHLAHIRYRRRLSGPLMDRIDICVPVGVEEPHRVLDHEPAAESAQIRVRVVAARSRQTQRQGRELTNSRLDGAELRAHVGLSGKAAAAVRAHAAHVSSRGLASLQKVARTIADLEGEDRVEAHHVHTAWRLRMPVGPDEPRGRR